MSGATETVALVITKVFNKVYHAKLHKIKSCRTFCQVFSLNSFVICQLLRLRKSFLLTLGFFKAKISYLVKY